jgi:hypothetical protein
MRESKERNAMKIKYRLVCEKCPWNTVEPLITDTAGEFKFCPYWEVYVSWSSSSTYGGDSGNRIRVSVIRGSTVVSQPFKKSRKIYGNRRSVTVFTRTPLVRILSQINPDHTFSLKSRSAKCCHSLRFAHQNSVWIYLRSPTCHTVQVNTFYSVTE